MKTTKTQKFITAVANFLRQAFSTPANFANAFPPKKDGSAPAEGAPAKGGTEDPGKGNSPDPGTGKTFDFRNMLLQLLGLPDDAQDQAVQQAFNSCMATEPKQPAVAGKPGEAAAGTNNADAGQQPGNDGGAAALAQAHTAVQNLAKAHQQTQQAQQANEVLARRCERAEGAFAAERNAHIKTLVNTAVAQGKLTKAQGESKIIELANAKTPAEFEAGVTQMANIKPQFNTTSQTLTGQLERTIAPGTASGKYLAMVNEAVAKDPKHDYNWHWNNCRKTPEGKSLFDSMKQPETNPAFEQKK